MGACVPTDWPHRQWRRALPWAMLLLLLGSQLLVTHCQSSQEKRDSDDRKVMESYFPATVEYALHIFNMQSKDVNAYRLVRILNSWKEQAETMMVFSMELELRRTRCGKFDEDIDNCPFEESSELNNTLTCFFTVDTEPWRTTFHLLNETCTEGFHCLPVSLSHQVIKAYSWNQVQPHRQDPEEEALLQGLLVGPGAWASCGSGGGEPVPWQHRLHNHSSQG
ncbi:cystatin-9-like [Diceros bicornis minor]|uniref:cystatin-9-like n=1 Tax=Diceros bicornis minor TaxID=77932 RepID=UPI0026F04618|nr:cystatin-9-like [Diceros bicornis minor]